MYDVKVQNPEGREISPEEIEPYKQLAENKYGERLKGLEIAFDGEDALLTFRLAEPVKFERVRRITGYLVGTMDKWNDAKRAEERERVKHGM